MKGRVGIPLKGTRTLCVCCEVLEEICRLFLVARNFRKKQGIPIYYHNNKHDNGSKCKKTENKILMVPEKNLPKL